MNIEKERNYLTLFTIVLGVLVFVMLYVWQSIEVMKIKLEYRALLRKQESLVKVNDRLRCGIERFRTMERIESDAERLGLRHVLPSDIEKVEVR